MHKFFALVAALFILTATAAAQDSAAESNGGNSASETAVPVSLTPSERLPWQVGAGFQFLHFNVLGQSFDDYGFKSDVTRYFANWYGLEGTFVGGWGRTGGAQNLVAKSFFLGGGPHVILYSKRRLEPWAHVLVGFQRFRFTQTSTIGANPGFAFLPGGGADYKLYERAYLRFQGDYIGSINKGSFYSGFSFGTSFVLNF